MKKALFVATVARQHIMQFHIPYLEMLQNMGYEVHVAAKNDFLKPEDTIPFCDSFHELPFQRNPLKKDNWIVYQNLKKIIFEEKFELIHCHTPVGAALTRLAIKSLEKRYPEYHPMVIYTAHGFHFFKGAPLKNWLLYYPIEKYLSRYTDKLITINSEDYQRAKEKFSAKKVYLVNGVGVDLDRFAHAEKSTKDVFKELALPQDAFVVLSVGELNKNKNHRLVIEALGKVKSPRPIIYLIAGLGPLVEELKNLAQAKKVELRLLGYRNDIPSLLQASDVFAFPSKREGLSLSMMEAMASSKAIVASSIRGNNDLINHGQDGYLFDPVNGEDKLIEELNLYLSNSELQLRMGQAAYQKVQSYSLIEIKKVMKDIYEDKI